MWILRRKGGITAKRLAQICNCRVSKKYLPKRKDFIINYGVDYKKANLNANVIFDKLKVLEILKENNILVPKIYNKDDEIPESAFPLLGRKKYHSQGRDIIYIHNREELNRIDKNSYSYLIEYINKRSEYRVHVLKNYKDFVSVKYNKDGKADPIVRSKNNGWKQIKYGNDFFDDLVNLSNKVLDVLGYDFGAVDIIRRKNKLYTLEINSAPGLEERKLQIYADYFKHKEEEWKTQTMI